MQTNKEGKKHGAGNDNELPYAAARVTSCSSGRDQSVSFERERARFLNEKLPELTLPPEGDPEGYAGPVAIVTETRTSNEEPVTEDQ
tara:strand:- start:431 stop:691 length:261 start_codon:yes stop_codon:yes gene_type:complete